MEHAAAPPLPVTAEDLNRACPCRSLDPKRLRRELEAEPSFAGLADDIALTRPHLFSAMAVFLSSAQLRQMNDIVTAVEQLVDTAGYRDAALERAPAIARLNW